MSYDNSAPAGWYADPQGFPQQRYWDGQGWTAHVAPAPAPAPAPQELNGKYNPYDPQSDLKLQKNTPSRLGLIFGIVCLFINPLLLIGVGSIVWSSLGIGRANRWARQGHPPIGRAMAGWGLFLGIAGTLGSLILKGGIL